MPRTSQQNQQLRDAARARLLDSAMKVFAEEGYAQASVRKIAAEAGVSLGLLYHYFSGKEDLLAAVFEDCMSLISASFAGVVHLQDPLAKNSFLIRSIFETLQSDPVFWSLFQGLRSQPAVMRGIGDSVRLWTGRLRNLFIENLTLAGRPEPEVEARLLYSLIEGTIQQYLLEPNTYPLEAVVQQIHHHYGEET